MMAGFWKSAGLAGALLLAAGQADRAKTALYAGPDGIIPSSDYAVQVDGGQSPPPGGALVSQPA